MAERHRWTAEEKARMVLEIVQDGKKISEVAEENNVHPNQLISWKKQFLESAVSAFKIARKDSVIAEIASENMELKKTYFGRMSKK